MAVGRLRRSTLPMLALLMLTAAVAYWLGRSHPDDSTAPVADAADADDAAALRAAARADRRAAGASATMSPTAMQADMRTPDLPPLPDVAQPLKNQLPVLLERAERGDPTASCRLIVGLHRCRAQARHQQITERMQRMLERNERANETIFLDIIAATQAVAALAPEGFCEGLDLPALPDEGALFHRAVHAMTPRQKTLLAMMKADGSLRRVMRPPSRAGYGLHVVPQFVADHGIDLLMQGYRAFDPLALEGMVLLHAPGSTLTPDGATAWLPNPEQYVFYATVMGDLLGRESLGRQATHLLIAASVTMPPDRLAAIQAEAQREVQRWRSAGAGPHNRPPRASSKAATQRLLACEP